jgi:Holliday junction resolvasome RuvABC ATP-dependent DNA helicase subunit
MLGSETSSLRHEVMGSKGWADKMARRRLILLTGMAGSGKTTLAHIIATEMGVRIVTSSGPAIEKGGDLISILTHLERGDVFFYR